MDIATMVSNAGRDGTNTRVQPGTKGGNGSKAPTAPVKTIIKQKPGGTRPK